MARRKIQALLLSAISILLYFCNLGSGPTVYERIYIDTYHPEGSLEPDTNTQIWLYDSDGVELAVSDDGGAKIFDVLDYVQTMQPGVYYLKVAEGPGGSGVGPYDIRVQALKVGDTPAATAPSGLAIPDAYETDDTPEPWNGGTALTINLNQVISRALAASDVDWLKLVLP